MTTPLLTLDTPPMSSTRHSLRIPDDTWLIAEREAEKLGVSTAVYVTMLIKRYRFALTQQPQTEAKPARVVRAAPVVAAGSDPFDDIFTDQAAARVVRNNAPDREKVRAEAAPWDSIA